MHAEQAERTHLLAQLSRREGALLEPRGHVGQDPVAHELAHGVAQQPLLGAQQGVDAQEVTGVALAEPLLAAGRCAHVVRSWRLRRRAARAIAALMSSPWL